MRTSRIILALLAFGIGVLALGLVAGCAMGPRVPDVTGKSAADAVRILQDAGYKLGDTAPVYTPGVAPGIVVAQVPGAGTRLAEGKSVSLRVATSLGEFVVPAVTGKLAEDASATIAASSLTPLRNDQYSDTIAAGTVMGQVPEAGAKVDLNATVVYVVSMGKTPSSAKVPNVVGKSKSDADKAIKSAGLVPAAQEVYSTTVAKDIIVIQSPAAGATAGPGSTVSYAVSLGKPASSVTVPSVSGKSEADAVSAIQGAGLVAKVYRQSNPTVAKGVVIDQMPPGGTKTAKGGTVGMAVSTGPDSLLSVPNVAGKTETEAISAIESAGFVAQTVEQPSADVAKGSVITQLPVGGSKAPAGSTIVVAISTGTPNPQ